MKLQDRITNILEEQPHTRNSDHALFRAIINETHDIHKKSFATISLLQEGGQIPSFESIGRARRKIQEHHPRLRGDTYENRQELCDVVGPLINTNFEQALILL